MKNVLTVAACVLTAGLSMGCSHDKSMDAPGPSPTALPQQYKGTDTSVGGINTESHMGSDHPMQSPAATQP